MNISYNWLTDLIDLDLSPDETAQALTRVGLAVEGIHPHGDDFVLDIDLTSNRPDCLSHLGVARELRVITNREMRTQENVSRPASSESASDLVSIEAPEICHRFTARIIRNVKIGPSPQWLVDRLEAVGERSINNVADITNFVMHELGQPMHSFDLDKLSGNRIVVRLAKPGETVTTLDEVERKLDPSMLAICDAERPVSIGGVMGGIDSGITESTTTVLLEVAYFKRESIRQTSRKLNLATEASYRFERGVDIENVVRASERATALICELAGGEPAEFVDVYPTGFTPNKIHSTDISATVKRLTGLGVGSAECIRILNALGIGSDARSQTFTSPSWRYDIAIEEDLVEEVARHVGYENIAAELPPAFGAGEYQLTEPCEKQLRQTLVDMGFDEAISYSFIDEKHDDSFAMLPGTVNDLREDKFVTLQDSVIEGSVRMRASILPGLLDALRLNLNHQRRDLKLFEIGKVFASGRDENELPLETKLFSLAITGGEMQQDRFLAVRPVDLYDAKGAVEAGLTSAGIPECRFAAADLKHLRRGRSAEISLDGETIGYLGQLSEEIAANYKFRSPVYIAEINVQKALAMTPSSPVYRPLPRFPAITRDISLVGDRRITFDDVVRTIREQGVDLCRDIHFVDVYEGKGLEPTERSMTIRLEYRSDERTLVEAEIEAVHTRILAALNDHLGVKQRI